MLDEKLVYRQARYFNNNLGIQAFAQFDNNFIANALIKLFARSPSIPHNEEFC